MSCDQRPIGTAKANNLIPRPCAPPPPRISRRLHATVSPHPWGNIAKTTPLPRPVRKHNRSVARSKTCTHEGI